MKVKTLLDTLTDKYFQFANFLLEDELQAMQLVVDVTTALAIENRDCLVNIDKKPYQLQIYQKIYELAERRANQLGIGELGLAQKKYPLKDRAVFFLSEVGDFSQIEIGKSLNLSDVEVIQAIEVIRADILYKIQNKDSESFRSNSQYAS